MDIYFKKEYGKIFELNGDGKLEVFKIDCEFGKVNYQFLKREIDSELGRYFDISTPYGYGGPVFSDYKDSESLDGLKKRFQDEFSEYCGRERIVSEFIRFHPIIKNHEFLKDIVDVVFNRHTICLEVDSEEKILENLTSVCRNRIKKSFDYNITIKIENKIEDFYNLYIETMKKNCADEYYYFSKDFFQNTMNLLCDGAKIFSAYIDDELVSSVLVLHQDEYMHYHLIGSSSNHKDVGINNRLIFEIAKWGSENGKKYLHLGGGYMGDEDSVYHFKSTFTKKEPLEFYIGKKIHDKKIYNQLVDIRMAKSPIENSNFFPLYRAK
ncbi:MAG: GNAT family N-acetyltransferase [Fusobacteriaceae bacterium]